MDLVETWKSLARARFAPTGSQRFVEVRVTFGFALLAVLVGLRLGLLGGFALLFVLGSVLLAQELPGAWVAHAFGRSTRVVISAGGGHTELCGARLRGAAGIAFLVSGTLVNLLVAAACVALLRHGGLGRGAAPLLKWLALSHAAWGLAQALPALPFRVGQAIAAQLPAQVRAAHVALSASLALTCAVFAVSPAAPTALFPLALFAVFGAMRSARADLFASWDERSGVAALAAEARTRLHEGDATAAAELAERALAGARAPALRGRLWETLAWAAIGQHDALLAHRALARLPVTALDAYLVAAYLSCCNRIDEAIELLREARSHGCRDRETSKLLIDLLFRRGDERAALEIAHSDHILLSVDDRRAIRAVLPSETLKLLDG